MNRKQLLLAMLSAADGRPYTPVQIQKALFLVSKNLPALVNEGPGFHFEPYDFGPFDSNLYSEAEAMQATGEAVVAPSMNGRWKTYAASDLGAASGRQILEGLPPQTRDYITGVSEWVRKLDFNTLVRSIYEVYPEMRANSIFRG